MKYYRIYFHLIAIVALFFIASPSVFAEEKVGQAVFKDLLIEKEGAEVRVAEPIILFEGQHYLPLKAITKSLDKNIYVDEATGNVVIENSSQTDQSIETQSKNPSQFRPSIKFTEDVSSNGVLIMEDNKNNIMFEKNGYAKFYPASTTKILTALVALEHGNLQDKVIVSENVNKLPGDSRRVFVQPGDELTLEQLLYGMLLYSGNDCALAIAEHIAGSKEEFAKLMNEKAIEVGATHSNFVNPHGYHHPDHYTTPYDLALILKAASENPQFLEIIKTPVYQAKYKNRKGKYVVRRWTTTNSFLKDSSLYVDGIIGGKTGYTDAAKRTLVTVAERNGHRYFVIALKGNSLGRFMDTRKLLLRAYQKRVDYDKETIKSIKVSTFDHSLAIDEEIIPDCGQLFVYKGRTYISQSLVTQILADIEPKSIDRAYVKIDIKPKFVLDELIIEPSYTTYRKQQEKADKRNHFVALSAASIRKMQLFMFAYHFK
ncbi:D-alanyl-D-alanine carboxypeptidase family protein [Schinkia sp. CFF1]